MRRAFVSFLTNGIIQNRMKRSAKIGKNTTVSESVTLQDGVTIGENVILEGDITVGSGTRIDHGVIIRGTVTMGKNNWIYPYCIMGTGPLHISHKEKDIRSSIKKNRTIKIGNNNVIREYTSVHLPITGHTVIGSDCYIMPYCHVSHDCILHDGVILSNNTMLGGHVEISEQANIGYGNNIHQYRKIGAYSMLGMGGTIVKDVLPFSLIIGQKFTRINDTGLRRGKIKKAEIEKIRITYENGLPPKAPRTWYEKEIARFMKSSKKHYPPAFGPANAK